MNKFLENYLNSHIDSPSLILNDIEQKTKASLKRAHMISGAYQGRFLSMISKMINVSLLLLGLFLDLRSVSVYTPISSEGIAATLGDAVGRLIIPIILSVAIAKAFSSGKKSYWTVFSIIFVVIAFIVGK